MKCATCLLALCAFQPVFANFVQELDQVHTHTLNEMEGIVAKHEKDVDGVIAFLKSKGATDYIWECKNQYDQLVASHESQKKLCEGCYKRGIQDGKFEIARKCYGYNLDALQKQDKKLRERARMCLTKYMFVLGPRNSRPFYQIPV